MANLNMDPPVRRGLQPIVCSICGSVWFRLATFASDLPSSLPPPRFAICLCGTAALPQISGTRSAGAQPELDRLLQALTIGRSLRQMLTAADALPDESGGAALADRIARLERSYRPVQKRILPEEAPVPKPLRSPPRRVAATHGLDAIALELQRAGLRNFRQARRVVWLVRDAWKAALAAGESVESPAGVLSLRTTASGRRRVHLEAASDLCCDAIEAAPQRHNMPPIPPNASSSAQCPRCGSQWFAQHEFHRYANQFYSSTVGGSMYAISEHSQFARICLCGMLFQPKRSGGRQLKPEDQSFLESWEKAQASQQLQSEAEERLEKRLRTAVRSEDFQQLAARLEAAEKTVAQLQAELKGRHLKARRKRSARK